ncbi:hypothetical protein KIPB_010319 [Kipferlia bialata]|uniref:Uncharacterized protein n=1 Tax=Kipferlia bialata TaxID=797122 RepID=A0A9K3GLI2_9EUKA|nr:hypothetical protein KIPB_010319 [Kipferlia bialata]|eukprot:g10319.t1
MLSGRQIFWRRWTLQWYIHTRTYPRETRSWLLSPPPQPRVFDHRCALSFSYSHCSEHLRHCFSTRLTPSYVEILLFPLHRRPPA